MSPDTVKVGVVGCGNISGIYCEAGRKFEILQVAACTDIVIERAEARAQEFGIPAACTVEELLANPEVEIVLNITVPSAHGQVGIAALEAGKHVYNEKPLAVTRGEGRRMLELARQNGLRVGGAPDTFLGAGGQTCRKLIDDGCIGKPVAAAAFMLSHGHEGWHPDPEFFYKPGGGPVFDMGPYYLTALVNLMGPVRRVSGEAKITFPVRTITSEPKRGQKIEVEVPTHVTGTMEFASGAVGTIIMSNDVWGANLPCIEVYGTEGSLSVPDPNGFGGAVRLLRPGGEWREMPLSHGYAEQSRGLGVADMASAIRSGRPHRASAELTYHVLEIMHAFQDAGCEGRYIELESTCERPEPLPTGLAPGTID
jgi:predicted dehydrogenase